jgi:hypothetical protein
MGIFEEYSGNLSNDFQVAQGMQNVIKQQQMTHEAMLGAVEKFNTARDEMKQLQAQTGAVLAAHGVDENGKPDDSAPKYVHDLYNAVNKEGGIANMSRSQMVAGLKAYETGTSVEANRLQIDAQRIKVDEMKAAISDRNAIREAQRRAAEGIKQLGTTKDVTTKEITKQIIVDGEKINIPTEKVNPLMERLKKAREDKNTAEENRINDEIEELIYNHSSKSKPTIQVANKAGQDPNDDSAEDYEGSTTQKNPNYTPFVSASSIAKQKEFTVTRNPETGEYSGGRPSPTVDSNVVNAFKEKSFNDYRNYEKAKADVDKFSIAAKGLAETEGMTPEMLAAYKDSELAKEQEKKTRFNDYVKFRENNAGFPISEKWIKAREQDLADAKSKTYLRPVYNKLTPTIDRYEEVQKTPKMLAEDAQKVIDLTKLIKDEKNNLNKKREKIKAIATDLLGGSATEVEGPKGSNQPKKLLTDREIAEKAAKENLANVSSEMGKSFQIEGNRVVNVEEDVTRTVKKSMIEQTQDEFNLVTNHLKQIRGYVPDNWNLQTYAMSKGIVMPQVTDLGNGHSYVQVGGTGQIVQNAVQSTGMSLRDGKLLAEAQRLGQASNMNLSVNGFNFSGGINVNDVDMANKVKDGVFKNTRAIASVNQLLDIAENASLWDKITPSEIKGIAMAIQNQIQAAGRTEIGGSGAWSEQDQARIDKIVQDPTSLFNVVFAKQCIASLKGYRERITTALNDQGTVYGFKIHSAANQQQNTQQARVAYWTAKSMGKSDDEALQGAREVLGSNFQ